ncbi:MAG TPA: methylmalonyl-CoA mutase family protein, partial [Syntrophobacteraceae bacterium]|nr:methylmalonyl-CoA mutase family protein [Syntrophobacteraceae bacterium]
MSGNEMREDDRLLDMFPPHTYEQWRQDVDKQLKGAPFEKVLVKKTYEDIDIRPMYYQADVENLPHMGALPGFAPFVRGTKALGHLVQPWLIAQEIPYGDPAEF